MDLIIIVCALELRVNKFSNIGSEEMKHKCRFY
jgi:hypothetical protein